MNARNRLLLALAFALVLLLIETTVEPSARLFVVGCGALTLLLLARMTSTMLHRLGVARSAPEPTPASTASVELAEVPQ